MRLGCVLSSGVWMLLLSALPIRTQAQSYRAWSETELYTHGRDKVLAGKDLERAITLLSALVERKPGNADYQMTLGCACVSRLASLRGASEDAKIVEGARSGYKRRVKIWQAMQENSALPLFGKPPPVAPRDPTTPDDGKAYDPADKFAQKQTADLCVKALHSFHEAVRLGRSLAPKHNVEVNYTCGWGMLLLYRSDKDNIKFQKSASPGKAETTPDGTRTVTAPLTADADGTILHQDDMVACFKVCTDYSSKRADYWQSLAFAYAPDYVTDVMTSADEEKIAQSAVNRIEEAGKSLQTALSLKRADPDLLYQAALVFSLSLPDKAVDSLKKLTTVQNANAVNYYLLAEAYLKQARHLSGAPALQARHEALAAIEAGNQAPRYFNATLLLPVPRLLAPAWNYDGLFGLGLDSQCLSSLFEFLAGVGAENIQNKDGETLMRAGVCMMEMGLNALRHYEGGDLDPEDLRTHVILYDRAFYGMVCCGKSFKFINTAATMSPSPANTALADAYAQSAAYWRAWDTALTQK
jgi:tetratricopeptide (TPR) repeat protein